MFLKSSSSFKSPGCLECIHDRGLTASWRACCSPPPPPPQFESRLSSAATSATSVKPELAKASSAAVVV